MRRAFWIVVLGLLVVTRLPAAAEYFSIDNVNLALSLESFEPLNHRPQPPGYPFFVAFARLTNLIFRDATWTFIAIALLSSALCLPVIEALGKRMFAGAAGQAAVLLLVVNPVFWQASLFGPLRGFLALFSLLTAYCAWRAWNGEARWVLWGACALGIGGGFRPDLLPVLFPLWFISAIVGTRSLKMVAAGTAILGAITLVWVGALAIAVGSIEQLASLNATYLARESLRGGSPILGAESAAARRQLGRLVIWNALGVVGWLWAVPFALGKTRNASPRPTANRLLFVAVWLLPGFALQALIHIEEPAHTLFSIPALCLLGGWIIGRVFDRQPTEGHAALASAVMATALVVNVLLFLDFIPLPPKDAPTGGWRTLKNAASYGVFEASIGQVRWLDDVADTTMKDLKQLQPDGRPWVIVSTDDVAQKEWFTNWRIVRYYAPDADIWVTKDTHDLALHIRRDLTLEVREATPEEQIVRIPVPRGGRIVWLMESGGNLHRALQETQRLETRQRLFYTDIPADARAFTAWNYEFVPTSK